MFFIDATSSQGVAIQRWSTIKEYLTGKGDEIEQFYEQIVYRHLEGERSEEMIDNLEVFLKEAVGRGYGLSPSQLLFQRNTIKKP